MARDTHEIQADIMRSRERLRDIAEAIGWKADVPSRVRDIAREASATLRSRNAGAANDDTGASERLHRAGDAIGDAAGSARQAVAGTLQSTGETLGSGLASARRTGSGVGDRLPDRDDIAGTARGLARTARDNPLPLAVGGLALGAAAAALLPSTRAERERVGPVADRVVDRGADMAREAVANGQQAVRETVRADGDREG